MSSLKIVLRLALICLVATIVGCSVRGRSDEEGLKIRSPRATGKAPYNFRASTLSISKKQIIADLKKQRECKVQTCTDFSAYHDIMKLIKASEKSKTKHQIVRDNLNPSRPNIDYTSAVYNGVEVLHSIKARLTKNNIPAEGSTRPGHPAKTDDRMTKLFQTVNDDVGHMLALSLGGPNELINLVPQHARTNRNLNTKPEAFSFWRRTERGIVDFVRDKTTSHVDWALYIFYEGDLTIQENRRPVGFGLFYTVHKIKGPKMESGDITFENDFD